MLDMMAWHWNFRAMRKALVMAFREVAVGGGRPSPHITSREGRYGHVLGSLKRRIRSGAGGFKCCGSSMKEKTALGPRQLALVKSDSPGDT